MKLEVDSGRQDFSHNKVPNAIAVEPQGPCRLGFPRPVCEYWEMATMAWLNLPTFPLVTRSSLQLHNANFW